jgi:hypothetical protein
MSEKRRPNAILLLKRSGKKSQKVEIFNAELWEDGLQLLRHCKTDRFRLRVNGRWAKPGNKKYVSKTEFRDAFWRSVRFE